jgi:hypothetical protein
MTERETNAEDYKESWTSVGQNCPLKKAYLFKNWASHPDLLSFCPVLLPLTSVFQRENFLPSIVLAL